MRYLIFEGQLFKEGIVKVGDWSMRIGECTLRQA